MTKQDVQNAILNDMTPYLDSEVLDQLKFSLIRNMHGYDFVEEQTALSTFIDDNMEYLKRFCNEMAVNNVAESTRKQYYRAARNMLEELNKNFRDVTYDDTMYYFSILAERKGNNDTYISKRTLDTHRKHCKAFFNWCVDNEYIEKNPFSKFKKIKYETKEKEILTNAEIVMLRDACETKQELAVIDFLLSTGVRVSECCSVDHKNIDFATGIVKIYGQKTRKRRKVFLDAPAQKHIVEYLNEREGEQEALFVATKRPHKRLGKATIETITKRVAQRAGVNKKCTVHLFRRTLATTLYKKGMPLKDIAAILGNSVDILEKDYIILEDRDIERKYNMYVA